MGTYSKYSYLFVLTGPVLGYFSLTYTGIWPWVLPIYVFVLIPLAEYFSPQSTANLKKEEEDKALKDPVYDLMLYFMLPIQYILLFYYLNTIGQPGLSYMDIAGRVFTMGISCVVLGINVGHELGHRKAWHEQWISKLLLLSTLYMHFIIEHNKGHHKRVSTREDPASARYGESLYIFWVRSVFGSFKSAWNIEVKRLNKLSKAWWHPANEMFHFIIIQFGFILFVYLLFDFSHAMYFIAAAGIGFLFLETVNYLEHYGLSRKKLPNGNYEKVMPIHSWNSNHYVGRVFLFELTRHSDHHYKASRKYQILRHMDDAPQLPFGYPVMILMALFPPLWFYVLHRHMKKLGFDRAVYT